MADYNFTATARIPTRPLSYAKYNLALEKELLADYEKHKLYMSDINGNVVPIETFKIVKLTIPKGTDTQDPIDGDTDDSEWTLDLETESYCYIDIKLDGVTEKDYPIAGIDLTNLTEISDIQEAIEQFAKIFRITTSKNKLTVYAIKPVTKNLDIILRFDS